KKEEYKENIDYERTYCFCVLMFYESLMSLYEYKFLNKNYKNIS
ncbi:11717_t:CDS:1, partial [Scutellospora calospora]